MRVNVQKMYERSCVGKVKFKSERAARVAIAQMERRGADIARLCPYRCFFCDGWHFGHRRMDRIEKQEHDRSRT